METDERERARRPRRGAQRPVSLFPGASYSRESGNLLEAPLLQYPLLAAFAASSPLVGRGGIQAALRARKGAGFPTTRE